MACHSNSLVRGTEAPLTECEEMHGEVNKRSLRRCQICPAWSIFWFPRLFSSRSWWHSSSLIWLESSAMSAASSGRDPRDQIAGHARACGGGGDKEKEHDRGGPSGFIGRGKRRFGADGSESGIPRSGKVCWARSSSPARTSERRLGRMC
jgi:hypothetical protein